MGANTIGAILALMHALCQTRRYSNLGLPYLEATGADLRRAELRPDVTRDLDIFSHLIWSLQALGRYVCLFFPKPSTF